MSECINYSGNYYWRNTSTPFMQLSCPLLHGYRRKCNVIMAWSISVKILFSRPYNERIVLQVRPTKQVLWKVYYTNWTIKNVIRIVPQESFFLKLLHKIIKSQILRKFCLLYLFIKKSFTKIKRTYFYIYFCLIH